MNDMNNLNNEQQAQQIPEASQTGLPARKATKKRKSHTTAMVAGLLAGVIIVGGGAGFGGAYFGNKLKSHAVIGNNNSIYNSQGGTKDNTITSRGSSTLDDMQKDVTVPQRNLTSNVEFKTDGSYMYTRDLVNAVRDTIVYIETFADYRGKKVQVGSASGVIISKDGYIVTNNHVVEDSTSYTVKVYNTDPATGESTYETYDAELCGTDEDTDLAVIKIDAADLQPAKLGNSDELMIGDDVVAIGNPLGYERSVSKGIISGLNRQVSDSKRGLTAIQTDAPINSGNSGGALFNAYGEVVGIVNEKRVDSYAESMGFAITINEAKSVIDDLILNGYVTGRAMLGITYVNVTEAAALYRGDTAGWQVKSINPNMAVAESGLTVGDTIVEIDGVSVFDDDVQDIFSDKKPGDTVIVTVVRTNSMGRDKFVDIEIALSEYKGE